METDLYNYQNKNILTYLSYYSKVNQRAENYYLFIKKYKKYTSEYLKSITILLNSFTPSFNKVENNNNIIQINNNEQNIKNKIELDLSPLDKITEMIYKECKAQINSLNFFLKNIELSLDNFKGTLKQTKKDVEKQKDNCKNLEKQFIESISSFKKENEELIKDIAVLEDRIIKFYYLNKKMNKNYINENEEEINEKIKELKARENSFMIKENNKLQIFINFNKEIENCGNQIKGNTFFLIKIFKLSINSFSNYFLNFFNLNQEKNFSEKINIKNDIKNKEFKEYEVSINKNLKIINKNTIQLSLIQTKLKKYMPRILKTDTNNVSQEICDLIQNEGYNIQIEDVDLNPSDTLYIMEKLNVFNLLNKDNYIIEKEKNKITITELVEKLFQLKIKDENYENKMEEISKKIYEYLEKDVDYRSHFLFALGNQRANTKINLSEKLYDILTNFFSFIADMIYIEKDYYTENNLIILSQTFYKEVKNDKIYLYVPIKMHKLFHNEEYWVEYIKYQISLEVKDKIFSNPHIQGKINQEKMNKTNNEIIFSQILSVNQSMKNLELDDNMIIKIMNSILSFYTKLSPETKKEIMKYINLDPM